MSDTDSNYDEREQSEIKHYALRLYLEAAARIIAIGTRRSLKYVDCCAGPWEARSSVYTDTSFGIALSELERAAGDLAAKGISSRFSALLIEKDPDAFGQLEAFAKLHDTDLVKTHARKWDFTERLSDIVRFCSAQGAFSFIFIDPKGWQLAGISKIRPLLQLNPGEVLINLMSPFIGRFIKDNKTDFSDLLGTDFPLLRKLSGADLEQEIVDKYCELVKQEGNFDYVCSLPVMNPDMDSFNFHLIYATRHWKGVKVFKDVEHLTEKKTHVIRAELQQKNRQSKTNQSELYSADVQYQETCYQRLIRTNQQRAKDSVKNLLNANAETRYDLCWGEALQFSGVYEADIRAWIGTWEQKREITIEGKAPNARVLHVGKGLRLIRNSSIPLSTL